MDEPYDIFFTGSTNPRECIMIGGIGGTEGAIYLEFRTPNIPTMETQTTVLRGAQVAVAALEWTMNFHLGMVSIGTRRMHMTDLLQGINTSNRRIFRMPDGQPFHWRRLDELNGYYDLYRLGPNLEEIAVVAHFRSTDDTQLLYASVALCLNRWVDWQGM